MKNFLAIPILFLFASSGLSQVFYSYAFGKRYCCEISRESLAKSPSWDTTTDNPPLSPGKAVRLANALKDKFVKDSRDFKWHLISADLENDWWSGEDAGKKWWWSVKYEAHVRVGGESGIPNHLTLIVLMDGTVIEPKITKD
jgi:hypothetical protein